MDGQGHFDPVTSDRDFLRSQYLASLDIRVLRFENRVVFENLEGMLDQIKQHLIDSGRGKTNTTTPDPS